MRLSTAAILGRVSVDDVAAIETIAYSCYRSFAGFPSAETIDNDEISPSSRTRSRSSAAARTNLDDSAVDAMIERLQSIAHRFAGGDAVDMTERARSILVRVDSGMPTMPGMIADLTTVPLDVPAGRASRFGNSLMSMSWRTGSLVHRGLSTPVRNGDLARCPCVLASPENAPWQHFVAYDGATPLATTSAGQGDLAGVIS
jgi:hypothetical protein